MRLVYLIVLGVFLILIAGCNQNKWQAWIYFKPENLSNQLYIGEFSSELNCRTAARSYISQRNSSNGRYICGYKCNKYGANCSRLFDSGIPIRNIQTAKLLGEGLLITINNLFQSEYLTVIGRTKYHFFKLLMFFNRGSNRYSAYITKYEQFVYYVNKYNDLIMYNALRLNSDPITFRGTLSAQAIFLQHLTD